MSAHQIVFVCPNNAFASVLAEAYVNGAQRGWEAASAGLEPAGEVPPEVVEVLREAGLRRPQASPKRIDAAAPPTGEGYDVAVLMMGRDQLPGELALPGGPRRVEWTQSVFEEAGLGLMRGRSEVRELLVAIRHCVDAVIFANRAG